ncbi:hypothetical protein ABPG77_003029 [Micractinium sp. CCAP 211/92]
MWAVTRRVYQEAPFQWEQAAWNEILPTFLWGQGDEPPIRYRLLPVDQFSNIGVFLRRKSRNLPVNQVALHAGWLHGAAKVEAFKKLGYWHPDSFTGHATSLPANTASWLGWSTLMWPLALILGSASALMLWQYRQPTGDKWKWMITSCWNV